MIIMNWLVTGIHFWQFRYIIWTRIKKALYLYESASWYCERKLYHTQFWWLVKPVYLKNLSERFKYQYSVIKLHLGYQTIMVWFSCGQQCMHDKYMPKQSQQQPIDPPSIWVNPSRILSHLWPTTIEAPCCIDKICHLILRSCCVALHCVHVVKRIYNTFSEHLME